MRSCDNCLKKINKKCSGWFSCDKTKICMGYIATEPKTNADRIRNMTDEELARLISSGEWSVICPYCNYYGTAMCMYDEDGNETGTREICEEGALIFLQSEAKESEEE